MKSFASLAVGLLLTATAAQAQRADTARVATAAAPEVLECYTLTGRVSDAFNYPLTGATVMLRGHNNAFSTDAFSTNSDGKYLVTSKKPIPLNTVLQITAGGYTTYEHPLRNCKPLDITLEPLPGTKFKSNGRIKKTTTSGKIR